MFTFNQSNLLDDKSSKRFTDKKSNSLLLSESYYRLFLKTSNEMYFNRSVFSRSCGSDFWNCVPVLSSGEVLTSRNKIISSFCRDRLCPMCSWRRSMKIFGQLSIVMSELKSQGYEFLFLTLTVPNVKSTDLSSTIDKMFYAFTRSLRRNKKYKKSVFGCFRTLEITYNSKRDDFHPHLHIILAVKPSYFHKAAEYISHSEWLSMWRAAMSDESITQVHIERVSDDLKSIKEVSKYSVKDSDFIISDDINLTDKLVYVLSRALYGRRLVSMSGVFKKAHKALNLTDINSNVNDDLSDVHLIDEVSWLITHYKWSSGVRLYEVVSDDFCPSFVVDILSKK